MYSRSESPVSRGTRPLPYEATFEALLEAAPDGMVAVDASGTIRFVNRKSESLFGYDRGMLVGLPIETLVPESLRKVHNTLRAGYFGDPRTRKLGSALEVEGRRYVTRRGQSSACARWSATSPVSRPGHRRGRRLERHTGALGAGRRIHALGSTDHRADPR